jgi:hypothetical protein
MNLLFSCVLKTSFLKYKKNTLILKEQELPQKQLLTYSRGNNQFIKELDGDEPHIKRVPNIPKLITVVIDIRYSPRRIVTYYYTYQREYNQKI